MKMDGSSIDKAVVVRFSKVYSDAMLALNRANTSARGKGTGLIEVVNVFVLLLLSASFSKKLIETDS